MVGYIIKLGRKLKVTEGRLMGFYDGTVDDDQATVQVSFNLDRHISWPCAMARRLNIASCLSNQ